ncbi:GtrA family protein [Salinirarus marinus]|uniref:GtrA family protein n=1 Tax=Salinirarus marinus TaxID=3068310 RepID=UPI003C6CAD9B
MSNDSGRLTALLSGVRFGQFASVGAAGAVLDTATVVLLTTQFGVYRGASKLVGAELAIVLMFLINEHWTFAEEGAAGARAFAGRFLRSNVVRAGGVLVATAVFVVISGLPVTLPVGGEGTWLVVANVVGIGAGTFVNYVAESLFTWRVTRGV